MAKSGSDLLLQVPLLERELFSGDYLAFPLADPTMAAFGDEVDVHEELRLFLREHLARIYAPSLASFTFPESAHLIKLEIHIPRQDLPHRIQVKPKITFSAIVIPLGTDTWVLVPRLAHTFYVEKKENLEEAIKNEVKRMAAAQELDPAGYVELLPPREEQMVRIAVEVERSDRTPEGRVAKVQKEIEERTKKKRAVEVLQSIAVAVHDRPEAKRGPEVVGRAEALGTLSALLGAKQRTSVLLVGPELVGKTEIVLAWLRAGGLRSGGGGDWGSGSTGVVFATSGAQLIAGMSGLGQWQERVKRVMEAAETLDAILYFDNLADLFGDRTTSFIDIASAMKPYIDEGRVRVIGELTPEALDLFESRNVGFFAAFTRIRLDALSAKDTTKALHDRITFDTAHQPDRPSLAPGAVTTLMDLVERYHPYRPFPGKATRFYDELRTICERDRDQAGKIEPIGSERVLEAFSMQSGIPLFLLREDRALHKESVIETFKKRLIGQERAIERVVETVCVVKAQLQPAGKPLATFLFVGPTGVGKTELARTLAEFLFGSTERMVRFDMSEYVDPYAAERLIRGTDRSEGLLTRRVRQQPFSVLLLDEIEKAHPAVFDLLLQVCGEGRLTDARGRTAFFHNTIIIMTSNLGAAHKKSSLGIHASSTSSEEHFLREVNLAFRPEFVNRLDRIITFASLSEEEVQKVARIALERLKVRRGFLDSGVSLEVSEAALGRLAKDGYSEAYGARALRRHMEDHLVAPISRLLGKAGPDGRGGTIRVDDGPVLERAAAAQVKKEQAGIAAAFELRRTADQHLRLERVEQVKQQINFLLTQLAYGSGKPGKKDKRTSREIAELQTEHYRLSKVYGRLAELHADLLAAEELALVALFEGEDTKEYAEAVELAFGDLTKALVYVLLALEPLRDDITFTIDEVDDGRGLDLWLVPLLGACDRREWRAEVHFEGEKGTTAEPWPASRRYGPPRDPKKVLARLSDPKEGTRHVLVRVRGPYAGVLLALECGLHRWIKVHPRVNPVHLILRFIVMRTKLDDIEWLSPAVAPAPYDPTLDHTRLPAVREYDGTHKKLILHNGADKMSLPLADYFQRFDEIAARHLLYFERENKNRDELFQNRLIIRVDDE